MLIQQTMPDQEKVLNWPQAVILKLYIVLKITWFTTKVDQKYVYQMFVWNVGILKSCLSLQSTIIHCQFWILDPPFSILILNSPPSSLPPQSSAESMEFFTQNVLKIAEFPTKCLLAPIALLAAFSRSGLCYSVHQTMLPCPVGYASHFSRLRNKLQ